MAFNHYAKIKRILDSEAAGWYVVRIDKPTSARNFKGEIRHFDHYYRVFSSDGVPINFCKFQQLDRFAAVMKKPVDQIPIA